MNAIGNLIWLIFGGFLAAVGYFIGGIALCVTIVGIPWGLQCFKLAGLVLLPFGKRVISEGIPGGSLSLFCQYHLDSLWWLANGADAYRDGYSAIYFYHRTAMGTSAF